MITAFIDFSVLDILDIILVAVIIYQLYFLIRGTVAIKIFVGILIIYLLWKLVSALQMEMLGEILGQFIGVGVIALLIVFQQELRSFLLFVGNRPLLSKSKAGFMRKFFSGEDLSNRNMISVKDACASMSKDKTGALIVIANQSDPANYISASTPINADLSCNLLESIFFKNNPLHDGAVLIRNGKIVSARGILPVTESENLSGDLGMRHRAALGISEVTDAFVVVVSEQNGSISVAQAGKLHRDLSPQLLEKIISKTEDHE